MLAKPVRVGFDTDCAVTTIKGNSVRGPDFLSRFFSRIFVLKEVASVFLSSSKNASFTSVEF